MVPSRVRIQCGFGALNGANIGSSTATCPTCVCAFSEVRDFCSLPFSVSYFFLEGVGIGNVGIMIHPYSGCQIGTYSGGLFGGITGGSGGVGSGWPATGG